MEQLDIHTRQGVVLNSQCGHPRRRPEQHRARSGVHESSGDAPQHDDARAARDLSIAGEGEEKRKLDDFINRNNLQKNIFLIGHQKNIFPYFVNSKGFILSSLWEDPGFVLVESFFCKTPILTSDCWPGPLELVDDLKNGFVFENNNINSFLQKFKDMDNNKNIKPFILNGLKVSKKFTLFNHYKNLDKLLSSN